MSSTYGENLKLSIFGQSHGPAIGMTLDGIPAGLPVDLEKLQAFLNRRAPGNADHASPRKEADRPEILAGLLDGFTCGAPIAAVIANTDKRSTDYEQMKDYWTRRLKAIAERYDGVIKSFDVVNECTSVPLTADEPKKGDTHYRNFVPLSGKYPEWAFEQTAHYFRKSRLVLNETASPWSDFRYELSP